MHLKRVGESRFVEQALRLAMALGGGVLVGLMAIGNPLIPSDSAATDANPTASWLSYFGSFLDLKMLALLLLLGVTGAAYLTRAAKSGPVQLNLRAVGTGLMCAVAIGMFWEDWPLRIFVVLLVCVSVLCRDTASEEHWGRFWLVFALAGTLCLAGPILAPYLGDEIRAELPASMQINGVMPYIVAFAVAYCIKRLDYGLREFETLFLIMIGGVLLLFVEASLTFFLGRGSVLPGMPSSMHPGGMFESALVRDHHSVARLGLSGVFLSLYFFVRRSGIWYLGFALLSALLVGATLDRAPFVAMVLGLSGFLMFCVLPREVARVGLPLAHAATLAVVVGMFLGSALLISRMTDTRAAQTSANDLTMTFQNRAFHLARAADALVYNPIIGTGPHLDQFYTGSGRVPPTLLLATAQALGVPPEWAISRVSRNDLLWYEESRGYGVHSLWMGILLNWGVLLGGWAILYVLFQGVRAFVRLRRASPVIDTRPAWLALLFAFSLSISMMTTSGFMHYWFFVVVFYFVATNVLAVTDEGMGSDPHGDAAVLLPGSAS